MMQLLIQLCLLAILISCINNEENETPVGRATDKPQDSGGDIPGYIINKKRVSFKNHLLDSSVLIGKRQAVRLPTEAQQPIVVLIERSGISAATARTQFHRSNE